MKNKKKKREREKKKKRDLCFLIFFLFCYIAAFLYFRNTKKAKLILKMKRLSLPFYKPKNKINLSLIVLIDWISVL